MVLVGMPGIEKRVTRYPQIFSRIGSAHEFRALRGADIQVLPEERWTPVGIHFPDSPPSPEVVSAIIHPRQLPPACSLAGGAGSRNQQASIPITRCRLDRSRESVIGRA